MYHIVLHKLPQYRHKYDIALTLFHHLPCLTIFGVSSEFEEHAFKLAQFNLVILIQIVAFVQ